MSIMAARYVARVGLVIRMLRALMSVDQEVLAKSANISRPTLARLETMRKVESFRPETLDALLGTFRRMDIEIDFGEEFLTLKVPTSLLDRAAEKRGFDESEYRPYLYPEMPKEELIETLLGSTYRLHRGRE